MEDFER